MGWFYNGSVGQSQHGLEASLISLIDLKLNTAFALDVRQTLDQNHKTRVEAYAEQVVEIAPELQEQGILYLVGDAITVKKSLSLQ